MPPAIFLFLTGVTLAFLMDSTERKGMAPLGARHARRSAAPATCSSWRSRSACSCGSSACPAPWTDLFSVDILNCMGFAIALMSVMACFRTAERVRLCAIAGPGHRLRLAAGYADGLAGLPWLVRDYIVPDHRSFSFFPWGAYLAFGMSAGSLIRVDPAGSHRARHAVGGASWAAR